MTFQGFKQPEQNYSKLPHEFIDLLPEIDSLAELKVVLYVLRHTWGFSEFDKPKKMTLDELQNGRKRRDGSRMDGGTGLSVNSIKSGAEKAVDRGILTVEVDEKDMARIEKWYCLNMSDKSNLDTGLSNFDTRLSKVDSLPSKVDNRTEKEHIETKNIGTAYQRGEQERPDKLEVLSKMVTESIGIKKMYKADALLSRWSVAFLMKTTSKDWKRFAEYAIEMQVKEGWDPEVFIEWVKKQDGYPTYWSRKRMEENYPKAFVQVKDTETHDTPLEDWRKEIKL